MRLLFVLLLLPAALACAEPATIIRASRAEEGAGDRRRDDRPARREHRGRRARAQGRLDARQDARAAKAGCACSRCASAARRGEAGRQRHVAALQRGAHRHRAARRSPPACAASTPSCSPTRSPTRPSWRRCRSSRRRRDAAAGFAAKGKLQRAGRGGSEDEHALTLSLLCSPTAPAQAQFRFPTSNQPLVDSVKNVGKATHGHRREPGNRHRPDMAARLLGAAPLVNDARLQRYVNNVGRWLASQTERPGPAVAVRRARRAAAQRLRRARRHHLRHARTARAHAQRGRARRRARPRDRARGEEAPSQGDPEGRAGRLAGEALSMAVQDRNARGARQAGLASATRCIRAAWTRPTSSRPTASAW